MFPAALHVKRKILVFKIEIKPFFLTRLLFGFVLFLVIEGGQNRISSGENDHIFFWFKNCERGNKGWRCETDKFGASKKMNEKRDELRKCRDLPR